MRVFGPTTPNPVEAASPDETTPRAVCHLCTAASVRAPKYPVSFPDVKRPAFVRNRCNSRTSSPFEPRESVRAIERHGRSVGRVLGEGAGVIFAAFARSSSALSTATRARMLSIFAFISSTCAPTRSGDTKTIATNARARCLLLRISNIVAQETQSRCFYVTHQYTPCEPEPVAGTVALDVWQTHGPGHMLRLFRAGHATTCPVGQSGI